jgi:cell filamentation protein
MSKYDYAYQGSEGYCYPGTDVLINKLGIRDEAKLLVAEREIVSLKLLVLFENPILGKTDFYNFCKIHQIIFGDIFNWAGQIRKGDFFSKGNSIFCRGQFILESANKIMDDLNKENCLKDLSKKIFIKRLAYYMGEINALHPFREGNGRTCREFFRQLAQNADYILDFSKTDKDELLEADINAFNGKYESLEIILNKAIYKKGNVI